MDKDELKKIKNKVIDIKIGDVSVFNTLVIILSFFIIEKKFP